MLSLHHFLPKNNKMALNKDLLNVFIIIISICYLNRQGIRLLKT